MEASAPENAEEDVFGIEPLLRQPRRRRSSMFDRWIQDQQTSAINDPTRDDLDISEDTPRSGPRSHAYLAYPEFGRTPKAPDEVSTLNSYDLMDDNDIPELEVGDLDRIVPKTPTTPTSTPAKESPRSSKFIQAQSTLRNFHLSFRAASPAASLSAASATPYSPSRIALFPRGSRPTGTNAGVNTTPHCGHGHNRSSSLSALSIPLTTATHNTTPRRMPSPSISRWRPSVLGHFGSPSPSQSSQSPSLMPADTQSQYTPSRPSMSSSTTYTSATATTTEDMPTLPHKLNFLESIRSRSRGGSVFKSVADTASSFSVWSQPHAESSAGTSRRKRDDTQLNTVPQKPNTSTSRIPLASKDNSRVSNSNISDAGGDDGDQEGKATHLDYDPTRPHVAYSSIGHRGTLPRVSFASGNGDKKKKKLVISGIAPNDTRKFEGAKRWCETFGEVTQITRMPNGDLHVYFKKAEVADTVCRLRAKVYITGVGSVYLSWFTGKKR